MKVIPLIANPETYSCRPYYIIGDWKVIDEKNTLIDLDSDGTIISQIMQCDTGVGLKKVAQVIFTHQHFDHTGSYGLIKKEFDPEFYGYAKTEKTNHLLSEGMEIKVADTSAKIIHIGFHSHDSVCIYFPKEKILFSGDTLLNVRLPGGSFPKSYINFLEQLISYDLKAIYSGHDEPVTEDITRMLMRSLTNVLKSTVFKD